MRLLILQYAGDYREAVQRFAHGGSENYYAQKYTVDGLAELAQQLEELTVLCCTSGEVYDEILENGVRAVGGGFEGRIVDEAKIIELIQRLQPTHIVFYTSLRKVLRWAIKQQIQVLGMLAESIVVKNWRDRWHTFQLTHLLNQPQVEWVGSYGITSSKLLQVLGVKAEKIIPWDFLITTTPGSYSPKTLPNTTTPRQLVYVGSLSESKGVGDVFRAVALLRQQNFPFCLKVVGNDIGGEFANLAASLN
ncbi:MAG: glycosyl transferase family 1, partial [Leptolyngbyaceae cyanobacterium CAN_BIN12]|nr:glycosyl transferase family 1 [Leptolyngbyaceae cyanobacterium CAN_BIN12]